MSAASGKRTRPPLHLIAAVVILGAAAGGLIAFLADGHSTRPRGGHAPSATAKSLKARAGSRRSDNTRPTRRVSFVPANAAARFRRLEATLPGEVGAAVAPLGEGPIVTFGRLRTGHAWSTMKVPVLVTYMRQAEASTNAPGAVFEALARSAVERSDNAAIDSVFDALERADGGLVAASAELQRTLELAGDFRTNVNTAPNDLGFSTFGQTEWSAAAAVRFYRALERGCLLSPAGTNYLVTLMRKVEPAQRWGAGSVAYGAPVAFKGGWGPEPSGSYLVRQTAIIGAGRRGYVLSMLAEPGGAGEQSFESGQQVLDRIAAWASTTFDARSSLPRGNCR